MRSDRRLYWLLSRAKLQHGCMIWMHHGIRMHGLHVSRIHDMKVSRIHDIDVSRIHDMDVSRIQHFNRDINYLQFSLGELNKPARACCTELFTIHK